MSRMTREFFNRDTLKVAQELIGKLLIFKNHTGIITETEAYMGFDDPASHAFAGKTKRSQIMFGPPGFSYIYLIYGMYYCLNFVTEKEEYPAAVLIRGLLIQNHEKQQYIHLDGPGKICRHLGITINENGQDIITHPEFYVAPTRKKMDYTAQTRVGISKGKDKLWRFLVKKDQLLHQLKL